MTSVDEDADRIVAAYLSGATLTELAGRYGCSTGPIRRVLAERRALRRSITEAELVDALRAWAEKHGRQPSMDDWKTTTGLAGQVVKLFGTWGDAMVAAGFEALPPGDPRLPAARDAFDAESGRLQARIDAGESLGAVGRDVGLTGQSLGRRLRRWRDRYGAEGHRIPRRGRQG